MHWIYNIMCMTVNIQHSISSKLQTLQSPIHNLNVFIQDMFPYHLLSGLAKKCNPSGRKHWVCGPCLFLMISWTLDTWIPTYCFKIRKIHSNCKYLLFNHFFGLQYCYTVPLTSKVNFNFKLEAHVHCTVYNL